LSHRLTLGRGNASFFSPPQQVQKAIGEKTESQMVVEATPRAPFKMIEPQFLFELGERIWALSKPFPQAMY
jgi:hypothetical protein